MRKELLIKKKKFNRSVTKDKFDNRIKNIKNDKIKKSLIELIKIFREK